MESQADMLPAQPMVLAIIQGRMSSTRLPGKILLDIAGKPMVVQVFERVSRAKTVDSVIVATTEDPTDDPVEVLCRQQGIPCYRGSMHDVLDRYYQAARIYRAEVIVRVTADCPVIDPQVIDAAVLSLLGDDRGGEDRYQYDFTATRLPPPWHRTYPIGLDVEVCTFAALSKAWREADQPYQREHVMPYLYDQPGRFRVLILDHDPDYGSMRWTVDTEQDLILIRRIFDHFSGRNDFSWQEVLTLIESDPELAAINANVQPKTAYEVDHRL